MYFSLLKKIGTDGRRFEAQEAESAIRLRGELFDAMPSAYAALLNEHPEYFSLINRNASFLYAHSALGIGDKYAKQTRFPAFFNALNDDNKRCFAMSHPLAKLAAIGGDNDFLATLKGLFSEEKQAAFLKHCQSASDFTVNGEPFERKSAQTFRLATLLAHDQAHDGQVNPLMIIPPERAHRAINKIIGDRHQDNALPDKIITFAFVNGNAPAVRMMRKHIKDSASFKKLITPYTFAPQDTLGYPGMFEVAQELLSKEDLLTVLTKHGGFIGICKMGDKDVMEKAWQLIPPDAIKDALFTKSKYPEGFSVHSNEETTRFIMERISPEKRMEILRESQGENFELVRLFIRNRGERFLNLVSEYLTDAQVAEIVAVVPEAESYLTRSKSKEFNEEKALTSLDDIEKAMKGASEKDRAALELEKKGIKRWHAMQEGMDPPHRMLNTVYPYAFSLDRYKELLPLCKTAAELEDNAGAELNAFKLAVLFSYVSGAEKYIDAFCKAKPDAKQPLHDACGFNLPENGTWTPKLWANFLIKHPTEGGTYVGHADKIEKLLAEKHQPFPTTVREMDDIAMQVTYKRIQENPEFGKLAHSALVEEKHFNKCLDLIASPLKTTDKIPDIFINGEDIGCPGYYMRRLAPNDPKGLIIGHMLKNCQSIGKAGEKYTMHGATSPYGGIYVWCARRPGYGPALTDHVVAESWVWISKNNALVFDSFEREATELNALAQPFIEQFAHEVKRHGFNQVRLGVGGDTPKLELPKTPEPERWIDFEYNEREGAEDAQYDSKEQYIVTGRNQVKTLMKRSAR